MFLETHKAVTRVFLYYLRQKNLCKTILKDRLTETSENILDAGLCCSREGRNSENASFL